MAESPPHNSGAEETASAAGRQRVDAGRLPPDTAQMRALRESEAKYREIFETANEGIWILDADSVIETANQRMADILGYEIDELVGQRKGDFAFPEDQPYLARLFEERRQGKIQPAIEVRFRRKDGAAVWTLLSARPIFRQGRFVGALDMFTDITGRRIAEDRFRVFFESSAAGYALIDPVTHRFISVNRRFGEIAGRAPEALRGLAFEEITHPGDRAPDSERFAALFAGSVPEVTAEKRYLRPDGTVVWVHLTTTIVRSAEGKPELQMSVVQDITARKKAESELAESRTRLRLAIDAADLGVFYHDGVTGTHTWNDQLKQLVGLGPDEHESIELFVNRIHPEDRPAVDRTIARIMRVTDQPVEWDMVYRLVRPDGTIRWLKSNGVSEPRRAPGGENTFQTVGTTRDITAEKEFEAELHRQIAQRTRELDEKTKQLEGFCYTVAHDLRAPLRAINGFADCALEEIAATHPGAADFLERIRSATSRLDVLITDLLAYTRIDQLPLSRERIDLRKVVDAVLSDLDEEIRRQAAVIEVRDPLPPVLAEQTVLEQIVLNLMSNALKFHAAGEPPQVEISAHADEESVRLLVRDRGIGIPPQYQDRIFKVFERLQTSRAYPGTGVGLAIVARGAERMGGRYGVESEPGKGSTFWIELKRA